MHNTDGIIRVGYFLWLESLAEDVVKGQVLDVLERIAKRHNTKVVLIVFSRTTDYFSNYRAWSKVRNDVSRRGLRLLALPIVMLPARLNLFFAKWYVIPVVMLFTFPAMCIAGLLLRLSILHLRSYPLVPAAILVKTILPGKRVIFDTRSPFPEESVASGKWSPRSLTFRLWKLIEAYAISQFDSSVFVTRSHRNKFVGTAAAEKLSVIPNNAAGSNREDHFRQIDYSGRLSTYRDNFRFAYVGSLSRRGISSPDLYAEVLIRLRKVKFQHSFLFITREAELLKQSFDRYGILSHEYSLQTCEPAFVSTLLSTAHIGMNFLKSPDVRMSVKTAEYLAAGLPLLCNESALGAREIIEDYDVGVVATMASVEASASYLFERYNEFLEHTQKMHDYFSTERVSGEYDKLYTRLVDRK